MENLRTVQNRNRCGWFTGGIQNSGAGDESVPLHADALKDRISGRTFGKSMKSRHIHAQRTAQFALKLHRVLIREGDHDG
jgi:hypothetical protein